MNKHFWTTENTAYLSLYMFYAPFLLVMIGSEFSSEQEPNWLTVGIVTFVVSVLTILFYKVLKNEWTASKVEPYFGPKKIDKGLLILLVVSMLLSGIIFILYCVMFIMTWNQEPPYPHKWTEITMFWVIFVSLVLGFTALIKSMLTAKH
ncbi:MULTISPECIES: Asp23/Gls24 family envelope stress response protein [Acinetobacter]|uniref:hypothetical protein n=1 Tax=Acinetobacter TaxID=469 RepID=UPI00028E8C4F|nr:MULTISPECIES: hypothetical protein [Acinetobacter]EKU3442199.1 hypothetical protein [Acinetobacter baumannii]MDP7849729.1 hypothetical protein [Acinetobacter baumannii]